MTAKPTTEQPTVIKEDAEDCASQHDGESPCNAHEKDTEKEQRHLGNMHLTLMQPLLVVAPFLGYLAAYLIEIGRAGYYRIPTSYVAVGIEDALIMGSVLVVVAVIAFAFYKYLINIAPWELTRRKPHIQNKPGTSMPSGAWPRVRYVASLMFYVVVLVALIVLAVAFAVCYTGSLLFAVSVADVNASGVDTALIYLFAVGALLLLLFSLYLYFSKSGRQEKETVVPGDFAGLKNKHVVVGLFVALILGSFCYVGGFWLSSLDQNYLVDESRQAVVLRAYAGGLLVVAGYDRAGDGSIRLDGSYSLIQVEQGLGDLDHPNLRWTHCNVERFEAE